MNRTSTTEGTISKRDSCCVCKAAGCNVTVGALHSGKASGGKVIWRRRTADCGHDGGDDDGFDGGEMHLAVEVFGLAGVDEEIEI